jgi:delta 1-pyrroline-5-carboxylate dehydrogenase
MESKVEESNKVYDQSSSPERATPSTPNIPKKSSSRIDSVSSARTDSYIEDNKPLSITKDLLHKECFACEKRQQEKKYLLQELENSNRKLQELTKRNKLHLELTKRVQSQKEILEKKEYEIERMKNDLEVLGEKLVIEIQNREFYQDLNDKQGGELEDLTQTLFEEANVLVANEARERHGAQERVKLLEKQLAEQVTMAQMEHKQNLSLRVRIAALESDLDKYKK